MSTRSSLYRAARLLGDAQSVRRGPSGVGRRVVRKAVYRNVNRTTAKALRRFGL